MNKDSDTYTYDADCSNCFETTSIAIPKGMTIGEYGRTSKPVCRHCGCSTLKLYSYEFDVKSNPINPTC